MRKFLLWLLSEDELPEAFATALTRQDNRLMDLEKRIEDLEMTTDKTATPQVRKRIVTRTMSDYRQAMGEEEIHVPQG